MLRLALRFVPGLAIGYGIGRYFGIFGPLSAKHTLYADGGTVDFAGSNLPVWKREKLLELFADNPRARGAFSIMPNGRVWIARTIPPELHQAIRNIICA